VNVGAKTWCQGREGGEKERKKRKKRKKKKENKKKKKGRTTEEEEEREEREREKKLDGERERIEMVSVGDDDMMTLIALCVLTSRWNRYGAVRIFARQSPMF